MRQSLIACLAALSVAFAVGCGGSQTGPTAAATPGTSGAAPADPIASVVFEFFDAVRLGRTAEANQRLTPLALQRITELEMNIAPPGSPTASFQVGAVTQRQNDHALVSLVWSDVDADGKPYNEPILCEVRDVGGGQWRICGMAQDLGPGKPPMVLDFESLAGGAAATAQTTPTAGATGAIAPAATAVPMQAAGPVAQDPFLQQR